jgi:hypothetical protein
MSTTLIISDLHAPFHHPASLDFLSQLRRDYKPHHVVCIGDEIDAHGWSVHDRNPDAPGQGDELALAKQTVGYVAKMFPRVSVCLSNHGQRAARQSLRIGIPSAFVRTLAEVLNTPKGWQWAERWIVDGVLFIHGEGYSGQGAALKAAMQNRRNTVIGHVHAWAGVAYHTSCDDTIWGMNVGCMVDVESLAMSYGKAYPNKPTLGCGVIVDGVPCFVPMEIK